MNPFLSARTAAAYVRGRPHYHALVTAMVGETLALGQPVPVAVDVACGTGLSTLALTAIAEHVIGVDASAGMLAHAPEHERIEYHLASAEALPLPDGSVDLITVAQAFHWLDRAAFLREAHRVLRPGGWLVRYENKFSGEMAEDATFAPRMREIYTTTYPAPPRDRSPFTEAEAATSGFRITQTQGYTNAITFDLPALVEYLLSQSNFTATIDSGKVTADELHAWLTRQLVSSFAAHHEGTFLFRGAITYAQRDAT